MKPRRVLMTCDAVGGVWRYAVDLARGLGRLGVETILVGAGPAPTPVALAELAAAPIWLDLPPSWLADDIADIRRLGSALGKLQRARGADLVHVNQPAEAAFLEVDAPVVVAAHSCLTTWWRSVRGGDQPADWAWRTALEAEGFRRARAVVAPTCSHARAVVAAYGVGPVAVVPNASAAAAGDAVRKPLVVAAARWWDAGKNLSVLDAAAQRAPWPVLLYGGLTGPDGGRAVVRHARPQGERSSDDLRAVMRRAAVFVSPSIYEPFGLAALEAARSGAALVLSDIATYREIWEGAARFFDPHDADSLVVALEELAADPTERRRLSKTATERASRYAPERQVTELLAIYGAALARGSAALREPA